MIIYLVDLVRHDEMFSDIDKIWEIQEELCLEVEGKAVSRTEGNTDNLLIDGNALADSPEGKGMESTVITDIVMNHRFTGNQLHKRSLQKYIKDYMKSINQRETCRTETRKSKTFYDMGCRTIKHLLANFQNYQFFVSETLIQMARLLC